MSTYDRPVRRPAGITLLAVLIVIGGLLLLLGGITLILLRNDPVTSDNLNISADLVLWLGVMHVLLGLIYLFVARGLTRGSGVARGLCAFVTILALISNIYQAIVHTGNLRWSAIVATLVGVLILMLLFSAQANAFFRQRA